MNLKFDNRYRSVTLTDVNTKIEKKRKLRNKGLISATKKRGQKPFS